jgi:hypothetical protein
VHVRRVSARACARRAAALLPHAAAMPAAAEQARRMRVAALIAAWFGCNIGVLLLNKALLSSFGFGYPVFLTALHVRRVSCACACHMSAHATLTAA